MVVIPDTNIADFCDRKKAPAHIATLPEREAAVKKALAGFERSLKALPKDQQKALKSIFYQKVLRVLSQVHLVANITSTIDELVFAEPDERPGIEVRQDREAAEFRAIYSGVR
jgi:hypothetical protein